MTLLYNPYAHNFYRITCGSASYNGTDFLRVGRTNAPEPEPKSEPEPEPSLLKQKRRD